MRADTFPLRRRVRGAALLAGLGVLATAPASAAARGFREVDLVSDQAGHAKLTDSDLVNAWGLAAGPSTPLWVSDNGTDRATVYTNGGGTGTPSKLGSLVVSIPGGAPTGMVFSGTSAFGGAFFLFSSESGRITAWDQSDGTTARTVARVHRAVFKGLAISGRRLYATDFRHGRVDVFDARFHRVARPGFRDRRLPHGYAPFGIKALGGRIVVTYAKQDAKREDDVAGRGHGFVDVYSRRGRLVRRLVRRGHLNSPWGLVMAPRRFGRFGGDLLVGNFGDGRIGAYGPRTGRFRGLLRTPRRRPLVIPGLWDLRFGNGIFAGPRDLIFSAGPAEEAHGLLGVITAGGGGGSGAGGGGYSPGP